MLKDYGIFTAAAVQAAPVYKDKPVYFDSRATLDKALKLIKEAAGTGARLIVFPELFLPGFCYWSLDMRQGVEWAGIWAEYLRHSVEVPSEETDLLCRAARQANANVVVGINERDKIYAGRMYNSILYIDNRGEILGTHRKINITVNELLYHTRGDGGKNLRVYDMEIGKVSGLICGEHDQPLLKQYYIVNGAQINCSLWPGFKGPNGELPAVIPAMTQAMCVSGACWAVLSSIYIPEDQRPMDFYDNSCFDQTFGGSAIVNPMGQIVVGPVVDEETIVYGDIDLKVNEMARSVINLNGVYSRWDILSLLVREKSYEPIVSMESIEAQAAAAPAVADGAGEVHDLRTRIAELEEKLQALQA